jgi:hypothetical protein
MSKYLVEAENYDDQFEIEAYTYRVEEEYLIFSDEKENDVATFKPSFWDYVMIVPEKKVYNANVNSVV